MRASRPDSSDSMEKTELLSLLKRLGIRFHLTEHVPVMTVKEAALIHEGIPGLACKCLFLRGKDGRLWLIGVPSAMRADMHALAAALDSGRLSFASSELLKGHLGLLPGAVSLFGAVNNRENSVSVVIEQTLMQAEMVCFHPLVNSATVSLAPADLMLFLRHTGHEPVVVGGIGAT